MSTTTETDLFSATDAGVLTLTMNRPETLNSLTPGVLDGIREGVERAAADPEIRCIVIAGAGRAFSSGASLKDFGPDVSMSQVLGDHYNPTVMAMQRIEKPILASINGIAAGAGASVALACDFRIWADDARMALLFTRIGLVPDAGATYILPRLIGVARAAEMLMLGEDVHADKALDWGLAHRVVPAASLADETRAFAERLASLPRSAGMVKRLLRKTMTLSLSEQLGLEAKLQDDAAATSDFVEGVSAFLEKRPSKFTGRVAANGLSFGTLEWGAQDDPLVLCLHGYPDTAWTWRRVGPLLAARGYRVVAPFMRGYAPTDLAGSYSIRDLAADAVALRWALAGDDRPAILVGHDWGAVAAYAVPEGVFDRIVTIAVPPPETLLRLPAPVAARQARASWYMLFQQLPGVAERALDRLIPRLWRDWSPDYDASEDLSHFFAALPTPAHRTAVLSPYRALRPWERFDSVPTTYLHGTRDGCVLPMAATGATLIEGAGHFVQLERPEAVAAYVVL